MRAFGQTQRGKTFLIPLRVIRANRERTDILSVQQNAELIIQRNKGLFLLAMAHGLIIGAEKRVLHHAVCLGRQSDVVDAVRVQGDAVIHLIGGEFASQGFPRLIQKDI